MTGLGGVLQVGDRVVFDGAEHQVVTISGTSVRLLGSDGSVQVVALLFLVSSAGFAVVGPRPQGAPIPPFALLDAVPVEVAERARMLEGHLIEVMTGLEPGAGEAAVPRPQYDPRRIALEERLAAKAAELTASGEPTSLRTLQRMRANYQREGLWGLVDGRAMRGSTQFGHADARFVEALMAVLEGETQVSTGDGQRLLTKTLQVIAKRDDAQEVVVPSRATFYRLLTGLTEGRHTLGKATSRRQAASRPARPFTPTGAPRPGDLVQIDSTLLDVMAVMQDGVTARAELTIAVDVATRSICAALLRPRGTKAVDAALLLARMLVPEPMRPGWAQSLAMSHSPLPHGRLVAVDERLAAAAARPVIVPSVIGIDHGKVFISETFTAACRLLGISVQPARPATPTDKGIVERTFSSINSLFCQHVAGYTGSDVTRRGADVARDAVWTFGQLQDLLDEWIIAGWQNRPHDSLRNPYLPGRALTPNESYAIAVARAGYLPLPLAGKDYLELLPVEWRVINDYGITIDYRTYDSPDLNPHRRRDSGLPGKRGLWEVHYDPYDVSQVWVRDQRGNEWITVPWTHLPMVRAPFADFTWRHARSVLAARGLNDTDESAVARVLAEILTRAGDAASARVAARTGAGLGAAGRPPAQLEPAGPEPGPDPEETDDPGTDPRPVTPFGIFEPSTETRPLW